MNDSILIPVMLAGGSGTRLWPLSRAAFPKHLVELTGESSLLQSTASRLMQFAPAARIMTVAAAGQAILVRRQLEALDGMLLNNLLLEPAARNTAAAVAWAARHASQRFGSDCVLWVCPSDHLIRDIEALRAALETGLPVAKAGRIVTFGIAPGHPETGFGWIRRGNEIDRSGVHEVARFIEKPPIDRARAMFEEGGHLWNSGMFLMRADLLLSELEAHSPDILSALDASLAHADNGFEAMYSAIPSQPVDKAVMEHSDKMAVVPCDPDWSDVGSWRALWQLAECTAEGNAVRGDVLLERSRNNLVRSEHRLVALAGVRDLAVIETADAVLVGALDDADAIKGLVSQLVHADRREATLHALEHRPWGLFKGLAFGQGYQVREVVIDPGQAISRQAHEARDEHWVVVEGRACVRLGDQERTLETGAGIMVGRGTLHQLSNASTGPLRVIEIQIGADLTDRATRRFPS